MRLDLSKSNVKEHDIFNRDYQRRISEIHQSLHSVSHSAGTTWVDWPLNYDKKEFAKILKLAKEVKNNSDALLVIGIGGSYLGAKAGIELLRKSTGFEVVFAGINFDYSDLSEKLEYLKDRHITVNVVSKSGTTVEILSTLNIVERYMKNKYKGEYKKRMIFTTDKEKGYLRKLAETEGIELLTVPDDMGGRYSVLSAVGLFPFACADLNIKRIIEGASQAYSDLITDDIERNDAYKYAIYRHLIHKKFGKKIEIVTSFSSKMKAFGEWLTQLFDESEGKDGKGMFVTSLTYSTDLHSVGQFIQQGSPVIAETFINVLTPQKDTVLSNIPLNSPIKFLDGKSMGEICKAGFDGTVMAHSDAGVPIVVVSIDEINEFNYGYLVYFFEVACAASAYLLGVNPFNQPGVEQYKNYMRELLKR